MKNKVKILGAILFLITIFLMHSCKKEKVPTLTTAEVKDITVTTATSGGTITSEGSSKVISRGVCWSTGTTPTITDEKTQDGEGTGSFTSYITGLNGATQYNIRAYATNSVGTEYGIEMSFTTFLGLVPTVTTGGATNIYISSATLNGTVNANYLSTLVSFEYGTTGSYGTTVTATQNPVTGNTNSSISVNISGLTLNTTYHFRVKAVNELGTTYGRDMIFATKGGVIDIDGNVYSTITYGNQEIFDENLKTTRYNDGTPIPNITDNANWLALAAGAYCDYANNPSYSAVTGRLYNWYAVASTNPKNVCPVGWHVLNFEDWNTIPWCSSFESFTNSINFQCIIRSNDGSFKTESGGRWWSSYEWTDTTYACFVTTSHGDTRMTFFCGMSCRAKNYGLYVRCVKGERIQATVPSVITSQISPITMTSAMSGGN